MTFASLLTQLNAFDPELPLVFTLEGTDIGAGYHVTELRHLSATGIDCGGTIEIWEEAKLQLFDLPGKTHMSVAKFSAILKQSLNKLPSLADTSLSAEFALGNIGLRTLSLSQPRLEESRVLVELQNLTALCKPLQRQQTKEPLVCSG
jgi:hypothetical protein